MTIEERIEEAKRRYPIGTKFKPAHIEYEPTVYTVTGNWRASGPSVRVDTKEGEVWTPLVYYQSEDKWATVISYPTPIEPIIINSYSII